MTRWHGRVALVTGASSGIGAAIVADRVAAGMKVVATARRLDRLGALALRLSDGPGEVWPLEADLRDVGAISAMFDDVRGRWGGVDVLVNNAGLGHHAPLTSGDVEHWREMLEVNVLALCVCTREAVADMRIRGDDGHVVHISSMAGHRVPDGSGVYSASKYAVRALTEGLRRELRALGSPIRITAISPGYVETEFAAAYHKSEEAAQATYGRFPVLQPEDIAATVAHVLDAPAHVAVHDVLMRPALQPS